MAPRKSQKIAEPTQPEPAAKPKAKASKAKPEASVTKTAPPKTAKKSGTAEKTPKIPAAVEPQPKKPGRRPKAVAAPQEVVSDAAPKAESQKVQAAKPVSSPTQALPSLAETILAAIQEGRAVEFIFADAETNPPRTFEPRQLIFDVFTKAWYVWGWDRRYNAERHHRVDLLSEVNSVEGVGRSAQGPYKEGTPANQIGGWLGGEAILVKAVLLKQWVFAVKQAPAPFPAFLIEDSEEGKATVTFTGTDLRAIARWCMQFGDGIQVLEPQRLIDRIKQVGSIWAGKPKQEPVPAPKPAPPAPQPKAAQPQVQRQDQRHDQRHERHEPRPEPRQEVRKPQRFEAPRENREGRESEGSKPKSGKIEIRFDKL